MRVRVPCATASGSACGTTCGGARAGRQPSISEAWLPASETSREPCRCQRGDRGEVGRVAGGQHQGGLEAAELGQFALEFGVQLGACR